MNAAEYYQDAKAAGRVAVARAVDGTTDYGFALAIMLDARIGVLVGAIGVSPGVARSSKVYYPPGTIVELETTELPHFGGRRILSSQFVY